MALIGKIRNNSWLLVTFIGLGLALFIVTSMFVGNQNPFFDNQLTLGKIDGSKVDWQEFTIAEDALYSNASGDIFRGQKLKLPVLPRTEKKLTKSSDSKWEVVKSELSENESEQGGPKPLYFYTHRNFYAITQYNHSVLYAMAVHDLSLAIASKYKNQQFSQGE